MTPNDFYENRNAVALPSAERQGVTLGAMQRRFAFLEATLTMAYARVGTNGQWRLAETAPEDLPQPNIFQYRPLAVVDLLLIESELATRKVVDTRHND